MNFGSAVYMYMAEIYEVINLSQGNPGRLSMCNVRQDCLGGEGGGGVWRGTFDGIGREIPLCPSPNVATTCQPAATRHSLFIYKLLLKNAVCMKTGKRAHLDTRKRQITKR